MADLIQLRRDTKANWDAVSGSVILANGEVGIICDQSPLQCKVGDGISYWNQLETQAWIGTGSLDQVSSSVAELSGSLEEGLSSLEANVSYVVCPTSGSIATKDISVPDFKLSTHCRLIVKMEHAHASSAAPTLRINLQNGTEKPLYYNGIIASSTNNWNDNETLDIYYDGTNYQSISIKDKTLYGLVESVNVGSQSSAINAFSSVPDNLKKLGLKVTYYDTVNAEWFTKQYISSDLSGWNTESNWNDADRFATGQAVNDVKIDGTELNNSSNNSLAKALDVQNKFGNLYGENKPQFTIIDGYSVNGTTGELSESSSGKYTEIELLSNAKTIQFKGLYTGSNWASSYTSGFAFGHYVDNVWVKDEAAKWDVNTETGNSTKTYIKNIPENATHFRMSIYSFTLNAGDIILYFEGDVQRLAKLNIVDNLDTNDSEKSLSAKQGVVLKNELVDLTGENELKPIMNDGYSISGADGSVTPSSNGAKYVEISVEGIERIEFVGLVTPFNGYTSGFSFGYYSNGEWMNVSSEKFDKDTSLSNNTTKIYERDVPENSTHFRTTILRFYDDGRFYIKTFKQGKIGLIVASEMLSNIADNLTTEDAMKALSAKQGVVLKDMVDSLSDEIFEIRKTPLAIESLETKWGYIGSSNNWAGVSQWRHFIIPVNAGEKYEIVTGANSCSYAFLTEDNAPSSQPSEYQTNPIPVPFVDGYANVHWMNTAANPQTVEEFIIPSGCNYLYVNKGYGSGSTSSNHAPSSVSKVEKVIKGSTDTVDNSDTNDTDVYDYPLYNLDGNGFSSPATMQENIAVRKINQVRFTGVPTSGTGSVRYGVPYSSNWEYYRYVGMSVSVYTYLTARANQYSLYNTENINSSASNQSAWGRHYHSTNNASSKFYGNVCCSFTALVAGQPFVINNTDFELGVTHGMLTRVNKPKKVNPYQLKIGDVFNNSGHSFSIYGIKYDTNRDVVAVRIAESTQGRYETNDTGTSYIIIGGIRLHLYSLDEFVEKVDNESFTHYRYNSMPKNLEYEKYATDPTNIQLEDTPQGKAQYTDSNNVTHEYEVGDNDTADVATVTYSTEICCFAGDKACFPVGELVVVNYALTSGTDISAYDRMKVYKDGVLFDTVLLSDAQQDSLVVSAGQVGHAVNLRESLQAGKYEACLANDSTESDEKTYWEVIDNSTLTLDSAGNLVVGFDKPVKGYWLGTMRDNNDGSYTFMGSKTTCRLATDDELYNQQITIDSGKLTGYTHIRLHIQGEYGMAAVIKPIPISSESVNIEEQTTENVGE